VGVRFARARGARPLVRQAPLGISPCLYLALFFCSVGWSFPLAFPFAKPQKLTPKKASGLEDKKE